MTRSQFIVFARTKIGNCFSGGHTVGDLTSTIDAILMDYERKILRGETLPFIQSEVEETTPCQNNV